MGKVLEVLKARLRKIASWMRAYGPHPMTVFAWEICVLVRTMATAFGNIRMG